MEIMQLRDGIEETLARFILAMERGELPEEEILPDGTVVKQ